MEKQQAAEQIADLVLTGFSHYRLRFSEITLGARRRFERAAWGEVQRASSGRINLYDKAVAEVVEDLSLHLPDDCLSLAIWRHAKQAYHQLIASRTDYELAETFFNSIFCRVFRHHAISEDNLFVQSSFPAPPLGSQLPIYNRYQPQRGLVALIKQILMDYAFAIPYENLRRDISQIIYCLKQEMGEAFSNETVSHVDIIKSVFYRNKAAYLVGRIVTENITTKNIAIEKVATEKQVKPFVLPLLNNGQRAVYVDTLIMDPDEVSVIFSFTRSYFMVLAPIPSEYVQFLQELLPWKQRYELYISIGFYKHGKTEFYRDFLSHLAETDDQFIIAPGVKGMVMTVFTLPSSQTVFKVIKDYFDPPKEVNKALVKDKYHLVKVHDRVGRMADTQEFSHFAFPKQRFAPELLTELEKVAQSNITITDDQVIVHHLYTERKMTPLNLYIKEVSGKKLEAVLDEYGNAIKQLAAANIFPGDMLLKNFGVTRHGRVVFYDYDEICYLTECRFRKIPPPRFPEDELAAEPWYSVAPNDVFPEEFGVFLFADPKIRQQFTQLHPELFDANYWQELQRLIEHGQVMDVYPYRRIKRFKQH
ncbi:bifunctional isocitrate dehydrogenase kinase/phosphatase [Spartinivicinus poritis]|uniref:Isocitrate dehydrogenase kinase/phosphatase n=1 Tax=Spartinivicinus poritis TaxID=2994640 RepID=A0ABT5UD13_9GAMM|nr:bifunctional isocitrate dehydrogenase kinase/phosphatase [Spartinivicinus sp. A2-2]MDE1463891.1 bifunctional isocitrate dehydrogenase kinase/phosphatase [Spartinivicinus sp. A2-2]